MIGIGLDAVDVERFRAALRRHPRLADRVFTPRERADMAGRADPVPGLAARFAAKEATMKALGVGIGSVRLAEIGVVQAPSGAPSLVTTGRGARRGPRDRHLPGLAHPHGNARRSRRCRRMKP
jgi:holo-[acyl-carrier protein] synthase